MKNKLPSVHLEFVEGTSSKEYNAAVEEAGKNSYVVNFSFGRIGGTLQTGSKTSSPVSFEEACSVYTKLVHSKTAKGYKEVGGSGGPGAGIGSTVVTAGDKVDTGMRPQLLNPITEDEAEKYLTDDNWCGQCKYDGHRMGFRRTSGKVIASNKLGWKVGFPKAIGEQLEGVGGDFEVDGECVGDTLYVFDFLGDGDVDLREKPYRVRLDELGSLFGCDEANIVVAPTAIGTAAKRRMLKELKAAGGEGMVFKRLDAKWYAGRPGSGGSALKMKFWSSVSCIVSGVTKGKRSVALELIDGDERVPIGKVTISSNWNIPAVGQICEVKYLYVAGAGGALYQPIYLGPRDDVDISECTIQKQHLKYKGEETVDEDGANAMADHIMDQED